MTDEGSVMKWRISSVYTNYFSNTLIDSTDCIIDHVQNSNLPVVPLMNGTIIRKDVVHNEVAVADFRSCYYILLTSDAQYCLLLLQFSGQIRARIVMSMKE
jgi:hypothetical protein